MANNKEYHYCEYVTYSQNYGDAIKHCYEDDNGLFWAGHDEYESQVNYCPYCGAQAPVQATELEEIRDKAEKRLEKIKLNIEINQGWDGFIRDISSAQTQKQQDQDNNKS